jgi:hypothetical protein
MVGRGCVRACGWGGLFLAVWVGLDGMRHGSLLMDAAGGETGAMMAWGRGPQDDSVGMALLTQR